MHSYSATVEVFRLPSAVWTGACKWSLGPAAGWCLCDWWSWAVSPSWAVIKRSWDQGTHSSAGGNKSKAWWSDTIGAVHQGENCGVLNSENFGASAAMAIGFSAVKDNGVFCRAELWVLQWPTLQDLWRWCFQGGCVGCEGCRGLQWWRLLGCLQRRPLGTMGTHCMVGTVWLAPPFILFTAICRRLNYVSLLRYRVGWTSFRSFHSALKGWRSWTLTLISFSPNEKHLQIEAIPLGTVMLAWSIGWWRQKDTVLFPLRVWLYLDFFASLCHSRFLTGHQSSPKAILVHK